MIELAKLFSAYDISYSYCSLEEGMGVAPEGCVVTGSGEEACPVSTVESSLLAELVT